MRKLLLLFTVAALVAALSSCGKKEEAAPAGDTQTQATQAADSMEMTADSMDMMADSMEDMAHDSM
ncbi:MAG TPA: hypothetical protein VLB27_02405 [candidate division Zixibacteria bacterium]|nr:hypothetical protein [candidate division Zixibacteria bacterium]